MNETLNASIYTIIKSIKWMWTLNASIYTTINSIKWMWTLNASIYTMWTKCINIYNYKMNEH